jgi:membrane protease YdiL (CAAX protease family)
MTCLFTIFALFNRDDKSHYILVDMLRWIGLWQGGMVMKVVRVLILNSLLFLGEVYQKICGLYEQYRFECFYKSNPRGIKNFPHYLWGKFVFMIFSLWEEKPNWGKIKSLAAAPFLEEFMYRGLVFGLYRDCGILESNRVACLTLLPLYFAIAHAHILWGQRHLPFNELKIQILIKVF